MTSSALPSAEIVVVGAGIIGLSIALELRFRGADVLVIDKGAALSQASNAAAGMLAAGDPHNPPELQSLANFSLGLYDEYLRNIENHSGLAVPYQTRITLQYADDGTRERLEERSLDPRQLGPALLLAARQSGVKLMENVQAGGHNLKAQTVWTTGAWSPDFHVSPRKGQMLRVYLPPRLDLDEVHRAEHIYIVPRTTGPQAGTALIGATVEDAGFDVSLSESDLAQLQQTGAALHPSLNFLRDASVAEAWAGLRPSTPDDLPVIGEWDEELIATGHFRNGILLAPATAKIVADLAERRSSPVDITRFNPDRFTSLDTAQQLR